MRLTILVCHNPCNAEGQAAAEYGGAFATAGVSDAGAGKPTSAHLPMRSVEDIVGANRRALDARAGKDAAKLILRSAPNSAWVRIDGKAAAKTPLLLIVAPGVYKVEMEGAQMESGRSEVHLLP